MLQKRSVDRFSESHAWVAHDSLKKSILLQNGLQCRRFSESYAQKTVCRPFLDRFCVLLSACLQCLQCFWMYNFVFDKRKVNVQCNVERIKILVAKFTYQNFIWKTVYKRSTGHQRVMLDKIHREMTH